MRVVISSSVKKYSAVTVLILIFLLVVNLAGFKAISVFSNDRKLPVYYVETNEKKAAITFDCAWGADDIPDILETLRLNGIKATFFFVGRWAEKHPEAVRQIEKEGHDIGNHSYSHAEMGKLDASGIQEELTKCSKVLFDITEKTEDLFRAPYGYYNNEVVGIAESLGYFTVQWNVDSLDWKPEISKEEIMKRVTSKLIPGSIILFHNDTKHTSDILPDIINEIRQSGYTLVPVSQLLIRKDYYIDFDGRQRQK